MKQINRPRTDVFALRLREARIKRGLSQQRLGVMAGLDPVVAASRIQRYESNRHRPDAITAAHIARVLSFPLPYFFADDDVMAVVIAAFGDLPRKKQEKIRRWAERQEMKKEKFSGEPEILAADRKNMNGSPSMPLPRS